jgi:RNA polymerase sigma factor (sigma-70 family)
MEPPPAQPLFPATAWTLVRRVQGGSHLPLGTAALDSLCRTYWDPVHRYLIALGCPPADAPDVTQDFFASFLRSGGFHRANPGIARLRTFIKHAATRHLQNHWRKSYAQRRSTNRLSDPLDLHADSLPSPDTDNADASYDEDWARTTLNQALTALEASYNSRGRCNLFAAIKHGLLRPGGLGNPAEVAAHLAISESQVRLAVHRARQRLADSLRATVAATVEHPSDTDDEVRYLLGIIARSQ